MDHDHAGTETLEDASPDTRALDGLVDVDLVRRLGLDQILLPRRAVSGTYRSATPRGSGKILEVRVDVDGSRPQQRVSGDVWSHVRFLWFDFTYYVESFVVENPVVTTTTADVVVRGTIAVYGKPGRTGETLHVHVPRVRIFSPAPPACVRWTVRGVTDVYACPKISDYFRTATLEVDRLQGTTFPPQINPTIAPSPTGLPATVSVREVFQRSGIDLTVTHDDVLTDTDSDDAGTNWSEVELHDLMETRFDSFANTLQWRMYGVVVPRFGNPGYSSGYYGVMFDWGGYQSGDTFLRQGCAIAEDAIRGRAGTLYDTAAEEDRLLLQTFVHEVGHTWNLPHSWQRTDAPSSASTSFMNYPWGYTGGTGGETAFWTDFAWRFDDVELVWMRHADRNDVIFGGRDWIGSNLSHLLDPAMEVPDGGAPVRVELNGPALVDMAQPVHVTVSVVNDGPEPIEVPRDLSPEAGTLLVLVERPDGEVVEHRAPVHRTVAPEDTVTVEPGTRHEASVLLSFAATGPQLVEPGQYRVRALLTLGPDVALPSNPLRIRVAHPTERAEEELTELVTRRDVAQFLYFGGSVRRPDLADVLLEAADRFEKASPATAVELRAAVGLHAARAAKTVDVVRGERRVVTRAADLDTASAQLRAVEDGLRRKAVGPAAADALRERIATARAVAGAESLGRPQAAKRGEGRGTR
ncbi:hypothetical protein [Isoptericola variabilis]|uniref:Uncharacterized protein n=1 Tax=Isoptericola variabilis (strain 225) TaxID=743718 RepID=F6FUE3_ISOV2|nr:hypothetical protein [Isoptericola variabilis]AEG44271.1 hypothetical protein Isova_1511 [Isoptericola variabilis 225]TWH28407.1 hypothetical protein L600_000400000060 [Isoptericola variabilis J7]